MPSIDNPPPRWLCSVAFVMWMALAFGVGATAVTEAGVWNRIVLCVLAGIFCAWQAYIALDLYLHRCVKEALDNDLDNDRNNKDKDTHPHACADLEA